MFQVLIKQARLRHHMLCYKRRLETLTLTLTRHDPVIFMHGIWLMVIHPILGIPTSLVYRSLLKMKGSPTQTFHQPSKPGFGLWDLCEATSQTLLFGMKVMKFHEIPVFA